MTDQPRVVVELSVAEQWSASGPFAERALELVKQSLESCPRSSLQAFKVVVCSAPAPHSGLGSGTQLALAIVSGVRQLCQAPALDFSQLVGSVGRGRRSAVGSYGFQLGGLIWEEGRLPGELLGKLKRRIEVPSEWRVVLVKMPYSEGLSGEGEQSAFERLPAVPADVTRQLMELAEEQILPAAERGDFPAFTEATYQYGRLAGNCFASVQGGPFASPQIAAGVQRLRKLGVKGVGQSSWGPTIFAFAKDKGSAAELIDRIGVLDEFSEAEIACAPPNNEGARIETIPSQSVSGQSRP